jgi:hypothetical protein
MMQRYLQTIESKISLTIDLWTSPNNKAFVSTTAHFIDNAWKLREILIDFGVLSGRHDGANIADGVYSVIGEYGLVRKVTGESATRDGNSADINDPPIAQIHAITVDNAHSNNAVVQELSSLFRQDGVEWKWESQRFRCFNHIMNLAVRNGLECLKDEVDKVSLRLRGWRGCAKIR